MNQKKEKKTKDQIDVESEKQQSNEKPTIYKIAVRKNGKQDRRNFVKQLTGTAGIGALGGLLANCDSAKYGLNVQNGNCTCHVECSCDAEGDDDISDRNSTWKRDYDGETCTCNSVCTCDAVCTCDSVCSCDGDCSCDSHSSSSCGGSYWYPN